MKLKSCPFCGGKAMYHAITIKRRYDKNVLQWGYVGCISCGCEKPALPKKSESIKSWNHRTVKKGKNK